MLRSKIKRISKFFFMKLNTDPKSPIYSSSMLSIVKWKAYLEEKENKDTKHQRLVATRPVRRGLSKGVPDASRPPALRVGYPINSFKAVLGVAYLQGIEGQGRAARVKL
jgi:hypothetical protein